MEIIFGDERRPGKAIVDKMTEAGILALSKMGIPEERCEISVTFVSPEDIKALNKNYRNIDEVTDVLSFPQFENMDELPPQGSICLGDVVICTEQALIQADEFGHSAERELVYLFVHSLVHLLGYDHLNEEEKCGMRTFEESIMEDLSLPR